jgi:hypothetical protein
VGSVQSPKPRKERCTVQTINREQLSQPARDALETFTNETGLIVEFVLARDEQWQRVTVEVNPETPAEREQARTVGAQR